MFLTLRVLTTEGTIYIYIYIYALLFIIAELRNLMFGRQLGSPIFEMHLYVDLDPYVSQSKFSQIVNVLDLYSEGQTFGISLFRL